MSSDSPDFHPVRSAPRALIVLLLVGIVFLAAVVALTQVGKHRVAAELASARVEITTLETDLATAEAKETTFQGRLEAIDSELGTAKNKLTRQVANQAQLESELAILRRFMKKQQATEQALTAELAAAQEQLAQIDPQHPKPLPEEVARYEARIAGLQQQVLALQAATSAGDGRLSLDRSRFAQVVTVGAESAFVIVNYGGEHGANAGETMQVRRGTEPVAQVKLSEVRERFSIAQVIPGSVMLPLRPGDAASLLTPTS